LISSAIRSETLDEIYAIVNDEIITYSELRTFETGMIQEMKTRLSGKQLDAQMKELKKNLLNMLIGRKILLSKAKEKKYDLNQYLKLVIKEIMKRNNLKNEEELKLALRSQGLSIEQFKKQRLSQLMQERYIQEEVGQKIKVDASEVVDYYRKNSSKYLNPEKITLHCIFLNKDLYFSGDLRKEKMKKILGELNRKGSNFEKIASMYSDLDTGDNKYLLGTFSYGDLDKNIEKEVKSLKDGKVSKWISTDSGWYLIKVVKRVPEHLTELKKVKDKIKQRLSEKKRTGAIKTLIEDLKKESYIKIIKNYK